MESLNTNEVLIRYSSIQKSKIQNKITSFAVPSVINCRLTELPWDEMFEDVPKIKTRIRIDVNLLQSKIMPSSLTIIISGSLSKLKPFHWISHTRMCFWTVTWRLTNGTSVSHFHIAVDIMKLYTKTNNNTWITCCASYFHPYFSLSSSILINEYTTTYTNCTTRCGISSGMFAVNKYMNIINFIIINN